jgi:hypothetical protein
VHPFVFVTIVGEPHHFYAASAQVGLFFLSLLMIGIILSAKMGKITI